MATKSAAGDAEEQAERAAPGTAVDAKKMKRSGTDDDASPGAGLSDDIVGNILAHLPARAAVASMALSKHHRRLIRSPEFRALHCRLAPPLPRPHIAYIVTAPIMRRPDDEKATRFFGFHVAGGAGVTGRTTTPMRSAPIMRRPDDEKPTRFLGFHVAGGAGVTGRTTTPMRSLVGRRYLDLNYINTCNGIVLLARESYSAQCTCFFWNPAVADVVEEVSVSDRNKPAREYLILGLGCGQRSKTYKLLLVWHDNGGTRDSFASFPLGGDEKKLTELPSAGWDGEGNLEDSLYIDGKIYLLNKKNSVILAFDVDEETVTSIDVPVKPPMDERYLHAVSKLMEMSGRPCLVADHDGDRGLWVLSGDHQWDMRFLMRKLQPSHDFYLYSIKGVWDCGGVLVLYLHEDMDEDHDILLYDATMEKKMFKARMQQDMTPPPPDFSELTNYALCWGYRPTLVSPSSIICKLNRDMEQSRECSRYIMKSLKPVVEQNRRKGQEATLSRVCFMDFLLRIMQKLPEELQQVLEMTMVDSDDPDFSFQIVPFA